MRLYAQSDVPHFFSRGNLKVNWNAQGFLKTCHIFIKNMSPILAQMKKLGFGGNGKKDPKAIAVARIDEYQQQHPELAFRVYETCAGLRFIVTNTTFEVSDAAVGTDLGSAPTAC